MTRSLSLVFTGLFLINATWLSAQDWPQWRGPNRDGHAAKQTLQSTWPEGGPKVKWIFRDTGTGYSEPAVVGGKAYVLGTKGESVLLMAIDMKTGSLIWESKVGKATTKDSYNQNWGGGPRSTPTIADGHAFVVTDGGEVSSVSITDGSVKWTVNMVTEYGGKIPVWGYSESPLVDGDRVIVTPGEKNFLVALNRYTGKQVWGSKCDPMGAQYVSVIKHTFNDVPIYITASKDGLFGFDAKSGNTLFSNPGTGNKTAVIPTAIATGEFVYHTSDYGAGNVKLKLKAAGASVEADEVYFNQVKSMQNHHGGVVLVDGVIYGFSKVDGGVWMAQDFATGEVLWSTKHENNKSGSIAYADGRLYCYNDTTGETLLVEPSRTKLEVRGSFRLPEQTKLSRGQGAIWTHPVIADKTLLLRDLDLVFAVDISR